MVLTRLVSCAVGMTGIALAVGFTSAARPETQSKSPDPGTPAFLRDFDDLPGARQDLSAKGPATLVHYAARTQKVRLVREAMASAGPKVESYVLLQVIWLNDGFVSQTQTFNMSFVPTPLRTPRGMLSMENASDTRALLLYSGPDGLGYVTNFATPHISVLDYSYNRLQGVQTGLWPPPTPPDDPPLPGDPAKREDAAQRRYSDAMTAFKKLAADATKEYEVRGLRGSRDGSMLVRVSSGDRRGSRTWVAVNPGFDGALLGGDVFRVWRLVYDGPRPEKADAGPATRGSR